MVPSLSNVRVRGYGYWAEAGEEEGEVKRLGWNWSYIFEGYGT